jgi:nitrogen regulatory protein P-II 1
MRGCFSNKIGGFMIKIEAIVREDKFEEVKEALDKVGVNGITVSQVMGCGKQKGYVEFVRGSEVDITLHPKIKFEIVVSSEEWEQKTIKAILDTAYTGKPGDGKIFSYDMRSVTRIRTKETGTAAIN